jgi:hypothetical protein
LPVDEFSTAIGHSKASDLALVLGTSMVVRPACELPSYSYNKNNGNMIICNKQKTPYDEYAKEILRADLDDIFVLLMEELGIEVAKETPEGLPVEKPKLELEKKYNEYLAKHPKKESKQESKQVAVKSDKEDLFKNVLKNQKIVVENKEDENSSISARPNNLLYFSKCENCQFTIPNKATKVVIDQCKVKKFLGIFSN